MRIALIGTRGIPANYGGFETCAEELALGLIARGHDVTVYCRPGNAPGDPGEYEGATLVYRPFVDRKSLGTVTHGFLSAIHAARRPFDAILVFNSGNGPLCLLLRLAGKRVAINVDGLEWKRAKWGRIAGWYFRAGEWASARFAHRVVSDARVVQEYYRSRYGVASAFIAYGAYVERGDQPDVVRQYGLEPNEYFFMGSRLEPENNADLVVEAFLQTGTDKLLAIAGSANWDSPFVRRLQQIDDPRIRLLGPVYTPGHIKELHSHCFAYIHGNEVGGTPPALLKALGYGNCVLALDTPPNAEVVGDAALLFRKDPADLAAKIRLVLDDPELAERYRRLAPGRVEAEYRWPEVVEKYEDLFEAMQVGAKSAGHRP